MPVFGLAAIWSGGASPGEAAAVLERLGQTLPATQALHLVLALHEDSAALELKVEVPGYPRAAVERLAEDIQRSGGTFIELWRLPKTERDALRARTLSGGTSYLGDERTGAAKALLQHLESLKDRKPRARPPAPEPASPPSSPPQRRGRRFAVKLELEFRTELDFVREHALNISNGGLFVRTAHRPPPDSIVTVDVRLPDGQRLQGEAVVAHVLDEPYSGGVGLTFLSDDSSFSRTLDDYLASLARGNRT
ncbi:TIGR02266 family protein [Myxococcaceae bacterium JPH2]|nr:TIGR02266 family protein [Myxococcaceae bacterium JPH2]